MGSTYKSNLALVMRYGDAEYIAARCLKLLTDRFKLNICKDDYYASIHTSFIVWFMEYRKKCHNEDVVVLLLQVRSRVQFCCLHYVYVYNV